MPNMKLHILVTVSLLYLNLTYTYGENNDKKDSSSDKSASTNEYQTFLKTNNKNVPSNELTMRQAAFTESAALVQQNAADRADPNSGVTYTLGINKYSDWTKEEKAKLTQLKAASSKGPRVNSNFTGNLPDSFDWRDHTEMFGKPCAKRNDVTPIKDQGACGDCYAFSAIAAIESQYSIKNGKMIDLSEQEATDCANGDYGNEGCNGGLMDNVFEYGIKHGIGTEKSYPFKGVDSTKCLAKQPAVKLTGYKDIAHDEGEMKKYLIDVGPISIGFFADRPFQQYVSGVYHSKTCNKDPNHGVVIVGYGTCQEGGPYWIVKNSWGSDWGMDGYFMIARGKNMCNIASMSSVPTL